MEYLLHKFQNGIVLAPQTSGSTWCADRVAIRAVVRDKSIVVALGQSDGQGSYKFDMLSQVLLYFDNDLPSAQSALAGVGTRNASSSNTISFISMHIADYTAPPQPALPAVTAFSSEIQMQWPGVSDDASGSGILAYYLQRKTSTGSYEDVQWLGSPNFVDRSVANEQLVGPGPWEYRVYALDFQLNQSVPRDFVVSKPPAGTVDPRRAGVRRTGAYWGGAGEQVDVLSGNVNFTLPTADVRTRTGSGVRLALSYNSQNWRKDASSIWNLGRDTGFGYGWRLQAGSITPVYSSTWTLAFHIYTDATGAEYRLNCSGSLCTSNEIFLTYDTGTNQLRFNDGTWWVMGVESAAAEWDAGTRYPSFMVDTNGNYAQLHYDRGKQAGYDESSSRLKQIVDARQFLGIPELRPVWEFTYDAGGYLKTILNKHTAAKFDFIYESERNLSPPWQSSATYGTIRYLSQVSASDQGSYTFTYAGDTGELASATLPYGATLTYIYRDFTYVGGRTLREIASRTLSSPSNVTGIQGMTNTHNFWRDDATDAALSRHALVSVYDSSAAKSWVFDENRLNISYSDMTAPQFAVIRTAQYTWALTPVSSVLYIQQVRTEEGGQTISQSEQTLDQYGNVKVTTSREGSRWRTSNFESLHENATNGTAYLSTYIRNRLTRVAVTSSESVQQFVPFQAAYDGGAIIDDTPSPPAGSGYNPYAVPLHDSATFTITYKIRGNATSIRRGNSVWTVPTIDKTGMVRKSQGPGGTVDTTSTSSFFRYGTVPGAVDANGAQTTLVYDGMLNLTSASSPDGTNTFAWDLAGRPTSRTNPDGTSVKITYSFNPAVTTEITANRWKRTWVDGLGRPSRVQTGYGGVSLPVTYGQPPRSTPEVTEAITDTEYMQCGCNPFGKPYRVSRPRTSLTEAVVWSTTTYDALGRPTQTVHAPMAGTTGNSGTTSYSYGIETEASLSGAPAAIRRFTTITGPAAGHWKKSSIDAFGDLREVFEPAPSAGVYQTSYQYMALGQLSGVWMQRDGWKNGVNQQLLQTRTFVYNNDGSLQSVTHPETGIKRYEYGNGKVTAGTTT